MRLIICRGAARGLQYLHDQALVLHRDLKPANILVVFGMEVRFLIADFGLATPRFHGGEARRDEARTAKVVTNGYVPPELLECRGDGAEYFSYDGTVDVWSLGVIAFEVAVLRPFLPRGGSTQSHLRGIGMRLRKKQFSQPLRGSSGELHAVTDELAGSVLADGVLAAL